jgi:hypothetical protein
MPPPMVPQRVTLLYSGVLPGIELLPLLGDGRAVSLISGPLELARDGPPIDVVVADVPAEDRRAICEQIRHHYRGPLIVLLDPRDNSHDLPPDHSRTLLTRPFSMRDLEVALAASAPALPASDPGGRLRLLPPHETHGRSPDKERTTVAQAVPRLVRSLQERRLVRVSAILAAAALAFMVTFGLVNKSDRCPPRCDALTRADGLTSSSGTTVQVVGVGPDTIDSGVGAAGPTTTNASGGSAATGGSQTDVATSGAARSSRITSWSSGAPSPTSPPDPTHPQPTAAPTTAAPTTTRPKSSTSTSTSTTTTTAGATTTTRP